MGKIYNTYKQLLNYDNRPQFLYKYEDVPSLLRLKNVGYYWVYANSFV